GPARLPESARGQGLGPPRHLVERSRCMAGASVLFLGTGDAFCNGGRLHTAFHVAADGYQALIDCGATTIAVMRHLRMDVPAIDAIVVSHLHGDHFGGIPFLLLDPSF